ncbi:hypothetical protein UA08_03648 [Talaromyces atroroseus]|uniref:holo-[acyl-carrier-protein] synthase n=1 Tax=Talaromyces atroroseus TaxID=1441469 RepID=A0A225B298_TALAT|nr:hypothetical protein UA08_03648 [Talaromyces atroroseus]OKL61366.1 hypothetical protein UA08_03648 [Talaromyces atroroseus]
MTSLTRWYIDTRHLTSSTEELPLVETLQANDQTAVEKYLRVPDKHMSLASNLLKYFFIHRTCRIPWSEVIISRTPKPHQRPCFIPSAGQGSLPAVEFNVSHQASFVALGGCIIPSVEGHNEQKDEENGQRVAAVYSDPKPSSAPVPAIPQVGIDITCVDEPGRRRDKAPKTLKEVADFIDIFSEVFSQRELQTMKQYSSTLRSSSPTATIETVIKSTLRLFYAYWALKEAYIKMTGEALLAPWLRELEFTDVVAPAPATSTPTSTAAWSEPYTGVQTWLYGKKVEDVRIELVAFESDYLVATAARGANLGSNSNSDGNDPWLALESIDIDRDVRPCATGVCQCILE